MNTIIHTIEQLRWNQLMLKIIHIDSIKEVNDKDPKFKVGDHVRISNSKIFLLKDTLQTSLKKFL